jgi:hypothetical protein
VKTLNLTTNVSDLVSFVLATPEIVGIERCNKLPNYMLVLNAVAGPDHFKIAQCLPVKRLF